MLQAGGGRVVMISMSTETMTRRDFVAHGPSGAGLEALARVMAADLSGTEGQHPASGRRNCIHGERIVASEFEDWLARRAR
jgi:hypothetical protein